VLGIVFIYHCIIDAFPALQFRRLGRSGIQVSELALGAMTFGREADERTSTAIVDHFLAAGGNLVDTADRYGGGESERIVGRALVGRRDEVILATKFRWPMGSGPNDRGGSRRHILTAVDASLRRLRTEWIDLYQMHAWDPDTPLEETLSTLDNLVRQGKVRYIGASNFAGWQLAKALGLSALHGWEAFVSLQPQYSLLSRDLELDLLPLCRHDGLAVLAWGPLGGGVLTGKYLGSGTAPADTRAGNGDPASRLIQQRIDDERNRAIVERLLTAAAELGTTPARLALRWVASRPGVTSTLIGVRSVEQLEDSLGAASLDVPAAVLQVLDEASEPRLGHPHDIERAFRE